MRRSRAGGFCPESEALFRGLEQELEGAGALDALTRGLLERTVATYRLLERAEVMVEKEGLVVASSRGGVRRHPATTIAAEAGQELRRLLLELRRAARGKGRVRRGAADELDGLLAGDGRHALRGLREPPGA